MYYGNQESDIYWYPDEVDMHSGFIGQDNALREGITSIILSARSLPVFSYKGFNVISAES